MKKKERIPMKGGDEYDVLTGARYYLVGLSKPGKCKKIKRKYNKRFRKKGKIDVSIETE